MSNTTSVVGAQHHVTPIKTYAFNVTALIVLMALTVLASRFQMPGGTFGNNFVALLIAVIKALLIIFVFMGLKWATPLCKVFCMSSFFFLSLMYGILLDYGTRSPDTVVGFHGDAGSGLQEGAARNLNPTPGDNAGIKKPGTPGSD